MTLAKTDPGAARDLAERWQTRGGAHPADHCYAVALVGLKQYKEGAARLETLAQAMGHAPDSLRAEVLDQAAQAWLLADDPARAYAADSAALNLLPGDPISSSTAPRRRAARDGTTRPPPISTAC